MTFKLINTLVFRNFKALKEIMMPFVIAVSVMFGLEYILLSLIYNDYLIERGNSLPELMKYANVLVGMLVFVFVVYAHNFIIKRRKKEFALNMVLGMEKKHIRLIILYELVVQFIIVSILGIVLGYLFGNLIFLALNKIIQNSGVTIMDYPFNIEAAIILIVFIFFVFLVLFIMSNIHITKQSPIQLMRTEKAGEKKTSRITIIILSILGLASLAFGYYKALTVVSVMSSLFTILIAAAFVLVGTYLIFMSVTFIVLNIIKNSRIYYNKNHFFTVSGLLSRMKSHAVGLASIAMILTFLIVTLGLSLTTYRGIQDQIEHTQKYDFEMNGALIDDYETPEIDNFYEMLKTNKDVESLNITSSLETPVEEHNGTIEPLDEENDLTSSNIVFMMVRTVDDHNIYNNENLKLKDNEVIVASNTKRFNENTKFNFLEDESLNVTYAPENFLQSKIGLDALYIVVPNDTIYEEFYAYYAEPNDLLETKTLAFNAADNDAKKRLNKKLKTFSDDTGIIFISKEDIKEYIYEFNGGLVFIGVVVSITLLVGLFLIMYYKQISEGYSDKNNYAIMQKLGLSFTLIKSTIRRQILVIFGLPIVTAIIHTLFASKIVYKVLGLLAINDVKLFLTSYISVALAIMVLYIIMYIITSKTYIKIISEK